MRASGAKDPSQRDPDSDTPTIPFPTTPEEVIAVSGVVIGGMFYEVREALKLVE